MTDAAVYEAPADEFDGFASGEDEWNGRRTRLTLAYPVVRDFDVVSEGEQITVNASLAKDGVTWLGPEAEHVRDLFKMGQIAGTEQALERRRQTDAVAYQRGVGSTLTDENGIALKTAEGKTRRKFTELAPMTGAQMKNARYLRNGVFGDKEMMRNSEQTENRDAVKELAAVLEKMTGASRGSFDGADAPGTAAGPDGTPVRSKR